MIDDDMIPMEKDADRAVPLYLTKHDGTQLPGDEAAIREQLSKGMLVMETMGVEGDVKKIWDPSKPVEVEDARRSFDALKAEGYRAYRTNEKGDQGEPMHSFDPTAGRLIMIPQMQGG
jgi:hypothetical protein